MKKKLNKTSLILVLLMLMGCDFGNRLKVYEELLESGFKGTVIRTELWKGGNLVIYLDSKNKYEEITQVTNDYYEVLQQIQPGHYFEKKPNSNKCLITKKDSIFYFDCVFLKKLDKETADSLSGVEQWDRNIVNKWMAIK